MFMMLFYGTWKMTTFQVFFLFFFKSQISKKSPNSISVLQRFQLGQVTTLGPFFIKLGQVGLVLVKNGPCRGVSSEGD